MAGVQLQRGCMKTRSRGLRGSDPAVSEAGMALMVSASEGNWAGAEAWAPGGGGEVGELIPAGENGQACGEQRGESNRHVASLNELSAVPQLALRDVFRICLDLPASEDFALRPDGTENGGRWTQACG